MSNLINESVTNCVPNDAVIAQFVAIMDEETIKSIRANNISKFDFALFVVQTAVKFGLCDLETAWDLVFGKGTYDKFKLSIFNILEAQVHGK